MNARRSKGQPPTTQDICVGVLEAAQMLRLSEQVYRAYMRQGVLPGTKWGRTWRVNVKALRETCDALAYSHDPVKDIQKWAEEKERGEWNGPRQMSNILRFLPRPAATGRER